MCGQLWLLITTLSCNPLWLKNLIYGYYTTSKLATSLLCISVHSSGVICCVYEFLVRETWTIDIWHHLHQIFFSLAHWKSRSLFSLSELFQDSVTLVCIWLTIARWNCSLDIGLHDCVLVDFCTSSEWSDVGCHHLQSANSSTHTQGQTTEIVASLFMVLVCGTVDLQSTDVSQWILSGTDKASMFKGYWHVAYRICCLIHNLCYIIVCFILLMIDKRKKRILMFLCFAVTTYVRTSNANLRWERIENLSYDWLSVHI